MLTKRRALRSSLPGKEPQLEIGIGGLLAALDVDAEEKSDRGMS